MPLQRFPKPRVWNGHRSWPSEHVFGVRSTYYICIISRMQCWNYQYSKRHHTTCSNMRGINSFVQKAVFFKYFWVKIVSNDKIGIHANVGKATWRLSYFLEYEIFILFHNDNSDINSNRSVFFHTFCLSNIWLG